MKINRRLVLLFAAASLLVPGAAVHAGEAAQGFVSPPDEARPMVRWWWFGSAVEPKGLAREISAMRAGGFGGFEIQPVYPLVLDDPAKSFRNLEYLSPDFLNAVSFANEEGRRQGMRVDMTLGSGWPYGGPHIGITEASAQIKLVRIDLPAGAADAALPIPGSGETLLSVYIADGVAAEAAGGAAKPIAFDPKKTRVAVEPADRARTVLAIIQSRTGQQVKRPGLGGEGYVLDHMNEQAVRDHLAHVGEPLMKAFKDNPPYAVFSDSLEVYGADWTEDLLVEFKKRRGYDLAPHLHALFFDAGPQTMAIRRDWGLTLSELTDERYLTVISDWARKHGTRFRSQTYGLPPVSLSSNRLVDLAEGEGAHWRRFTSTRWASSANHIYGKPVTSAESWTWLHSPSFRATPLDMKVEADTLALQGVNQFIAHGWPYTPPGEAEPGWAFYAAAVFNDHNPWWPVMPDVNLYMQRLSHLLRQGAPVADVAVLIPTDDAFAATRPGRASVNDNMRGMITEGLTAQILDAGYSFDYVDNASIRDVGLTHKVLILPKVNRIAPEDYRRIADFAAKGGTVIAVDRLPSAGAGLQNAEAQAAEVSAINASLFASARGRQVLEAGVGEALKASTAPDVTGAPPVIGFVHRKLTNGDLYFVANTSPARVEANLAFRAQQPRAQWWNPVTGTAHAWTPGETVVLAPYESRLFVFGEAADAAVTPPVNPTGNVATVDLSKGWSVRFKDAGGAARKVDLPMAWDKDDATRFYSGEAVFTRNVRLTAAQIAAGQTWLDFGEVTPSATPARGGRNYALVDAPVRDAAEVFVNGKRVGAVWATPYRIDLAGHLRSGANTLEVRVTNTAINGLAGQAPADYRLLNIRYGERFTPQDMVNLAPLPSGIVGKVTLGGAR